MNEWDPEMDIDDVKMLMANLIRMKLMRAMIMNDQDVLMFDKNDTHLTTTFTQIPH